MTDFISVKFEEDLSLNWSINLSYESLSVALASDKSRRRIIVYFIVFVLFVGIVRSVT